MADFEPEKFPLYICLLEYPVVRIHHPRSENAEQDDHHDELVDCPERVSRNIRDALFYLLVVQT